MVMVDDEYGTVLRADWAQQLTRDHHPRDGSRVYSVGGLTAGKPERRRQPTGSVVLLHGIGNSGMIWGPVLPSIAEMATSYRLGPVVAPTLSPTLLAGHAADDRTDAVTLLVDFLRDIAPPPWRIVGHSMGGVLTGLILRTRPDVIRQAVLLNSPLPGVTRRLQGRTSFDRTGRALLSLKALAQITAFGRPRTPGFLKGPELAIVRNALRGFVHDPGALDRDVVGRAILSSRTTDGVDFLRLSRQLPAWESEPFTARPVTIVLGERDPLVPMSDLDAVRTRYPEAIVHILPRCGHFAQLELPASTVGAIAEAFTRKSV
jgi:pimeloyl-ACP methyl ester carboxylesterase